MSADKIESLIGSLQSGKRRAEEAVLKAFSDRGVEKNRFFYLKSGQYFRKHNDCKKAFKFFKRSSVLYPNDELSSICTYIELVKMHKYKYAMMELDRFLTKHPANSYKITLQELLEGMSKGFSVNYSKLILQHCKNNNIIIPDNILK